MYHGEKHSIPDRIVTFTCRCTPIDHGTNHASVEFGPRLVSAVKGFIFMEKLSVDALNEGITYQD